MESKKYQYIDSLRGVAILLVVLVHIGVVLDNTLDHFVRNSLLVSFIGYGGYGVQLFLIVSAYTLTMSHYNRLDEPQKTRNFFIRRFFRIAPMYYIAIIYFTLDKYLQFNFVNPDFSAIPIRSLLSNVFFTNALIPEYTNNYVPGGWSVSVEFLFYFIMPFICSKVKTVNAALLLFLSTLVIALIAGPLAREYTIYPYFQEFNFFVQLPIFPLGILAYFFLHREQHDIKPETWIFTAVMVLVFCHIAVPRHIMFGFVFFLLLIIQAKYNYKLFSNRFLSEVGKVSFSMYLIHFAVIYLFNRFGFYHVIGVTDFPTSLLNFVLMYIVVAGISFAISSFTYRMVEVPGQSLGKKLIKKLSKQSNVEVG